MKKILFLLLIICSNISFGQTLYSPQVLYDNPTGIYDTDSLRTIHINFYNPKYDSILQDGWVTSSGLRLPATVLLNNGIYLDSVAIRYKGNSTYSVPQSFNNPKLPLNLDINDFISGQKLMGYKKYKLANSIFDPTFTKELNAFRIYRRYLPTPEGALVKVYVQGNYLGLYISTETIDKQFLKKHFNENDGILFKCDPIQQFNQPGPQGNSDLVYLGTDTTLYYNHYDLKSDYGWSELTNLIGILDSTPSQIDSVLNVDRVFWAFAVNQVIANLDVYNGLYQHNYYLYQTEDGLFQMIPWDLSESFVGALLGSHTVKDSLYHYDPYYGYNCYWYPLIDKLISDPNSEYSKIYTAHLNTVINESLDSADIKNYTTQLQSLATTAASTDANKFFGMPAFYSNVDNEFITFGFSTAGITSTITKRKPFLQAHPRINNSAPTVSNIQIIDVLGNKYVTANITNEDSVQLRTTTSSYNSKFKSSLMHDDGLNGDAIAGDNIYTAYLPSQTQSLDVKFYIRAYNSDAIMLNPQRAEYEFYIYSPATRIDNIADFTTDLRIYPNPTKGILTINSEEVLGKIELYNIYGSLISSREVTKNSYKLDLSNLAEGIYILKGNGASYKIQKVN